MDSGDGVVILCDLLFGTPCNRSAYLMSPRVKVLCGMNMAKLNAEEKNHAMLIAEDLTEVWNEMKREETRKRRKQI